MPGPVDEDDGEPLQLLARWQQGDQEAAGQLFQRYASRLVALARGHLSSRLAHRVDPEDVVQSVYRSFFADSREGRFHFARGGDLWQLLVTMTLHRLANHANRLGAQKRAISREHTFGSEDSLLGIGIPALVRDPSPLEAAALADELQRVLQFLEPPQRQVVELRLQGYNLDEVATQIPCSLSTVRRVLQRVKDLLEQQRAEDAGP